MNYADRGDVSPGAPLASNAARSAPSARTPKVMSTAKVTRNRALASQPQWKMASHPRPCVPSRSGTPTP